MTNEINQAGNTELQCSLNQVVIKYQPQLLVSCCQCDQMVRMMSMRIAHPLFPIIAKLVATEDFLNKKLMF